MTEQEQQAAATKAAVIAVKWTGWAKIDPQKAVYALSQLKDKLEAIFGQEIEEYT